MIEKQKPSATRASVPYPEPALSEAESLLSKNGREPGRSGGTGSLDIGAIINAGTYLSDRTRVKTMQGPAQQEHWQKLCALAAVEQDPKKLLELTAEINRLLEQKEKRLVMEQEKAPGEAA